MKILIGHNRYQWHGGEDAVVTAEAALLRSQGHDVVEFMADNTAFLQTSQKNLFGTASNFFWSKTSYQQLTTVLKEFRPAVAHFHNIYFALTPSVYAACRNNGVAVVQSLHNFRMFCANGLMFRDGHLCRECLEGSPLAGIRHRCYKDDIVATSLVTALTSWHRRTHTFDRYVNLFITATDFTRQQYVQAGLSKDQIYIKPNVYYPDVPYQQPKGQYALYVGRLSAEKGVIGILETFKHMQHIPLKIVGDGPLRPDVLRLLEDPLLAHVQWLGRLDDEALRQAMHGAKMLVVPSTCYENFPRVVVEGYAFGLPVVAFAQGSFNDIVREQSGVLVPTGSWEGFAGAVDQCAAFTSAQHDQVRMIYERDFSPTTNYQQLMNIYQLAISKAGGR